MENIIFYGANSEVNPVNGDDYNEYIKHTERSQDFKGFDSEYLDYVDYIIKITHKIWEERSIGLIYKTYHNNILIHSSSSTTTGIQGVIAGTLQTLFAFPDRKLIAQNVIWSSDGGEGYYSSHRVYSTATNLGDSSFGDATFKKVEFRTFADCAGKNNRIYEEWLVRDNMWIVKQLGLCPHEVAMKMAAKRPVLTESCIKSLGESTKGQLFPETYKAKDSSVGERMVEIIKNIYCCKMFDMVCEYYHENATVHYICNQELNGHIQIQGMLISFFASIPNGSYRIERITINDRSEENSYDVAVRWRLTGLHEGIGFFGKPSGKPVDVLGISHFTVLDNKIKEEWVTFDALDLLVQVYSQQQCYESVCEDCETEN